PPAVAPPAAPAEVPGYQFNYEGVPVQQVLDVYAGLVGRTLLHAQLPASTIVLKTESPLTKSEAIEALQAVLGMNNIVVIPIGDKFVKVVTTPEAAGAGEGLDTNNMASQLPDLGSYVTHIVQLKYVKPTDIVPILQPLARVNSIIPLDSNGILVIRDYAENVKRMLEMIRQIDVSVPQEYISEVIPIKYEKADDIAQALNSLGSGGATVAIGGGKAPAPVSGFAPNTMNRGGSPFGNGVENGINNGYRPQSFSPEPVGPSYMTDPVTPQSYVPEQYQPPATFQSRLRSILQGAAGLNKEGKIEVFGQAKIVADEQNNSLLVFATRGDMERIKKVISQLDVPPPQVLIDAIIMDVGLNKGLTYGVSAAQNPRTLGPNIQGAGGMLNPGGPPFLDFLGAVSGSVTSNAFPGSFTSTLPNNGFSYFGNLGPTWDVAVQAAEADSDINIIQRPRIETSQATAAQFFVGQTVPYITGTSYGYGYNGYPQSTYSQLSVGVELDVTPYINPGGVVVMQIQQEIDDISGSTTINGNAVPNTDKRTLSSQVIVKDKDTIMLGGFIRSDIRRSNNGIPLLDRIPLLGALFSARSSQKDREELVVLMRPTVLPTPELAAAQTAKEEAQLPGISAAEAENDQQEAKLIQAEKRNELKRLRLRRKYNAVQAVPAPAPVEESTNPAEPLP
ncbi:MAG: hypothetical protein KGR98_06055, partial [Verrucomicrobia bacterium]|nr:hypothetical protein [Verrucomicrobiota bacterium]